MTDIHGTDPDNRDDSLRDADMQDSITEVPPEYEFTDGLGSDDPTDGRPARRSALLPIVAALGGLVVLGGVAWWQLGENPGTLVGTTGASMPLPGAIASFAPPAVSPALPPETPVAPKTAASAPELVSGGTASVASSSTLPNEPVAPALQTSPEAAPALEPAVSIPTPATPPSVPAVAPTPAPSTLVQSEEVKATPQTDALVARIDELQKALDQANQQLKTAIPPETAAANEAVLQERIHKLEQQVAALTQKAPAPEPASETPSVGLQVDANKTVAPAKPRTVVKKTTAAAKPTVKKAAQPEKASWVLRSASPGTAWISKSADSLELREVHVGDRLPGIGRVTTIESQGDSWVVRGTSGSIH